MQHKRLLGILLFFALIGSTVFGSFSVNSRQGSEPIFSITHQGIKLLNPAPDPGSEGAKTKNHVRLNNLAKVLTPYLFTGRRWDGFSGQYWNRHRYYNPRYGRFSSRDPIGFALDFNLYRYANNNPVLNSDPTGKGVIIPVAIGVAVVALWTKACFDCAINKAPLLYTPKKYPCDYDKRQHFYTSCYFNRCMLNLWPQATFLGGLLVEVAGGDRNIDDVKANVQGIISAYTFGKDCQDLVIGNFGP